MANKQRGFLETVIRIVYISIGVVFLGISAWFALFVSPFNPYGMGITFMLGIVPLLIGILGTKKDVLKTFFTSGV